MTNYNEQFVNDVISEARQIAPSSVENSAMTTLAERFLNTVPSDYDETDVNYLARMFLAVGLSFRQK